MRTDMHHLSKLMKNVSLLLKEPLLYNSRYNSIKQSKIEGRVPYQDSETIKTLIKELQDTTVPIKEYHIDVCKYSDYISKAKYSDHPMYYMGGLAKNYIEKTLEHYVASDLLQLSKDDTYIDIANDYSPIPEIYSKIYGCKTYRQDLIFPEGINGNTIGGDAGNMPIDNNFATKMALHCSFEHFEGDSDIRFIKEVSRVLKPGGKVCILPLYLHKTYAIQTDPTVLPKRGMVFENDATIYCAKMWGNRHGRFYDVPHLISRIGSNLNDIGLDLTIFTVKNSKEVDSSCYLSFIALFTKKWLR